LMVNSGTQMVASYGLTVTYPSANLSVAAADVVAGAQGFVSAVNANTAGSIVASGFDTTGKGPGAALELLKITFTANAAGTASIGLTVQTLTDGAYANIGTPAGQGGTITITTVVTTAPRTATRTATATVAPTATRTATVAPTATRTATVAPTATRTATVAPTATRTATVAPTATRTATRTATVAPTATPAPTVANVVGLVSLSPAALTGARSATLTQKVLVNSGTSLIAAYGITIAYPTNLLSIVAAGVTAGAQGFTSAINANTAGSLVVSGFDTTGKGPGSACELLNLSWTAGATAGTGAMTLTVQTLTDGSYVNIGTPTGMSGTVTLN